MEGATKPAWQPRSSPAYKSRSGQAGGKFPPGTQRTEAFIKINPGSVSFHRVYAGKVAAGRGAVNRVLIRLTLALFSAPLAALSHIPGPHTHISGLLACPAPFSDLLRSL